MGRVSSFFEKLLLLVVVVVPLLATGYAIWRLWNLFVTPLDLVLLGSLYVLTVLGIGMGYHRMLTHRAFYAPAPVRFVLLVLGSMALQGPAIHWASTHIRHHATSDKEGDPHSPLRGIFHAHLGWLFTHPWEDVETYGKHLKEDRVVMFVSRTFLLWAAVGLAIPFAIGGWTGLLWGGAVRVFLTHHVTWSVNSICHTFGRKAFATPDESRNEWVVGLLALGEGWHNNHHAFPRSARHGLRWWQLDFQAFLIRVLERLRLVRDVWVPSRAEVASRLAKTRQAVSSRAEEFAQRAQEVGERARQAVATGAENFAAKAQEVGEKAQHAAHAVQRKAAEVTFGAAEAPKRRSPARRHEP